MPLRKRNGSWVFDRTVRGKRERITLRDARTKAQAQQLADEHIDRMFETDRAGASRAAPALPPQPPRAGFLYAVQMLVPGVEAQPVKLGFSRKPRLRVLGHAHNSPYPIEVLGIWPAPNGVLDEQAMLEQFAEHRLRGEWFAPAPAIFEFVTAGVSMVTNEEKGPTLVLCKPLSELEPATGVGPVTF